MNDPRDLQRETRLLLLLVAALGATGGIFETTLNNFLSDTFHITAQQRGRLEFPRELPGFLVAILGGVLFFLSEVKLGLVAAGCLAAGLAGLALLGDHSYLVMMAFLVLWSTGNHLLMPVTSTITLSVAPEGKRGRQMGRVGAAAVGATILGSGMVWVGLEYLDLTYRAMFLTAAALALVATIALSRISPLPRRASQRPKLVLKPRYGLYYLLCAFSGARKQVFITFGPWVLIRVFGEPAPTIAKLWIAASLLGVLFQPQLGRLVDRWGERTVLMADAALLSLICLGYGFAEHLPLPRPVWLVYACYVADQVLFATGMARVTYLDKIAESEADVHASLSLGVTIDHAVSMSVPALGGLLWMKAGYPAVFAAAAGIALCNLAAAGRLRLPAPGGITTQPPGPTNRTRGVK